MNFTKQNLTIIIIRQLITENMKNCQIVKGGEMRKFSARKKETNKKLNKNIFKINEEIHQATLS